MSVILIGKIIFRRGKEESLPGKPISISPLILSPNLLDGEPAFATDTARLFIGHTPNVGDINYQRTTLPYENLEVLTESSQTNQTLLNQFYRDQNRNDFFVPTVITAAYTGPILYEDYENDLSIPSRIDGSIVATKCDYHAFYNNGQPSKSGVLQIMANSNVAILQDTQNTILGVDSLTFSIGSLQNDKDGPYFMLGVTNNTLSDISLFLRKVNVAFYGL